MKTRNLLVISMTLALLLSLSIAVGIALAGTGDCGLVTVGEQGGLIVKKSVHCEIVRTWNWKVQKTAAHPNLTLATGETFLQTYTVTASATASDAGIIGGQISMQNQTGAPVTIHSVTDSLPVTIRCGVYPPGVSFPYELAAGDTLVCKYKGDVSVTETVNKATVSSSVGDFVVTVPIDWSNAIVPVIDKCADISDTYAGVLGHVCAAEAPKTFTYTRMIGPYETCGDYRVENTASFVTDSGATGSSSASVAVHVPCEGGCTLTPGYWKTHSTYGPAPYDDNWDNLDEDALFFLSGVSYYNALWTSPSGNAYWILAHAYIAAQLNQLNGADFTAAQSAFNQATGLLSVYTPAQIGAMRSSNTIRQQFISLASILDNYNNGLIGPGHCSE